MKYQLRFWFEHGGGCIWGMNKQAKDKYGYFIPYKSLPISRELIDDLCALEDEYSTYLDWNEPQNPSPWSNEHKTDFIQRATIVYERIKGELGADYEIENALGLR